MRVVGTGEGVVVGAAELGVGVEGTPEGASDDCTGLRGDVVVGALEGLAVGLAEGAGEGVLKGSAVEGAQVLGVAVLQQMYQRG